jgi:hypothetical protein
MVSLFVGVRIRDVALLERRRSMFGEIRFSPDAFMDFSTGAALVGVVTAVLCAIVALASAIVAVRRARAAREDSREANLHRQNAARSAREANEHRASAAKTAQHAAEGRAEAVGRRSEG